MEGAHVPSSCTRSCRFDFDLHAGGREISNRTDDVRLDSRPRHEVGAGSAPGSETIGDRSSLYDTTPARIGRVDEPGVSSRRTVASPPSDRRVYSGRLDHRAGAITTTPKPWWKNTDVASRYLHAAIGHSGCVATPT